ncbi:glucose-6-phosphate isomerase [Chromohalobacter israelensis]|uniref:Glucose-6-phosphate isomerase 2 n=1 Tax=Chromohalobacter israelensis (strain ATCC BAA-138 / DSM 3043 / CIP 106854 / NCIMB 13768 / 1H11) TaxID=290398 RepID=G6PI2_CHRI1|nr:glucose-6-phosphate isomerase [Chromohalobacter salexigens]Q1QUG5.1 RecName: Full=Glucose-6-phosphate isomerase 2; Short=GPI 2; AltName: Full=Phosphoglucose isomerase 2; Short=PGI 2; AltName: Full=Phosphohexose isomerase 2; Short=PHI 2 [Chromohalobacter salexigens DSM 3043]ABE59893.1 glucose-6-phosphate isomerase [Chromohalobacter salexigens DSM 3043]
MSQSTMIHHSEAWQALTQHADGMRNVHLKSLFAEAPGHHARFTRRGAGLTLDLSKHRWRDETLTKLLALAREANLERAIERLQNGERVNLSEDRPALHTALRLPPEASLVVEGEDVVPDVHETLARMQAMVEKCHAGQWRGATGKAITDVVNLGVGGSDLGPLMVTHALADYRPRDVHQVDIHFASTMDGSQLADYLTRFNPATTLFVLSSKSFTTIDTLSNASTARDWLMTRLADGGRDAGMREVVMRQHFIGVSAKPERMSEWGIDPRHQLRFWEWVGGRYSLWGAIGLPIALAVGMENFRELLAGAHEMDRHFRDTPLEDNLPVLLALAGIWNVNFLDVRAHSILPYDGRLEYFASYLEQLEMESNGKSVTNDGEITPYSTCPVLWGQLGPNAQHAFYQLLHQGTQAVECDFIAPVRRYDRVEDPATRAHLKAQHRLTLANCIAQSRVLMLGDEALPSDAPRPSHKRYRGNQPSTTLLLDRLTPRTLGALIALYEHKVFVQATIWDINPFDQWGVELGKQIASETEQILASRRGAETLDDSSRGLLDVVWQAQDAT